MVFEVSVICTGSLQVVAAVLVASSKNHLTDIHTGVLLESAGIASLQPPVGGTGLLNDPPVGAAGFVDDLLKTLALNRASAVPVVGSVDSPPPV